MSLSLQHKKESRDILTTKGWHIEYDRPDDNIAIFNTEDGSHLILQCTLKEAQAVKELIAGIEQILEEEDMVRCPTCGEFGTPKYENTGFTPPDPDHTECVGFTCPKGHTWNT